MSVQVQVTLKAVRCSYLNAIQPDKKYQNYGGTFLYPKKGDPLGAENHKAIVAAMQKVATEQWGSNAEKVMKQIKEKNERYWCLKDGDAQTDGEGNERDGYQGMWCLRASSKNPPRVFRGRDEITPDNVSNFRDGIVYSGCYAHVVVTIWAMQNEYGKGINASFDAIVFHKDGERFGGSGISKEKALDAFSELLDEEIPVATGGSDAFEEEDAESLFG